MPKIRSTEGFDGPVLQVNDVASLRDREGEPLDIIGAADIQAALTLQGLPVGGTTGQVLAKSSGTDYAVNWVAQSGGGGTWGSITGTLSAQTDLQAALDLKANAANAALTGTPTAPTATAGTNTTQIASTAFVKTAVDTAVVGLYDEKGPLDCSANPNYPTGLKGDVYRVTVAGRIGGASGILVDIGDAIICHTDNAGGTQASVGTSWYVLQANLIGALIAANNLSDIATPATARINLGLVIGTNVQAWNAFLDTLAAINSTSGTGAIARATSPTFVTPVLGTPTSGDLGNCTGFDFLSKLYSSEISVTGATTATIGRLHVCTGTSANYTVTLPAVSGNAGKFLAFRMSSALTKLVTLDGNASETIDGALTRVMWTNETALLYCNGTAWTKISGKSIPMAVNLYRSNSAQSVANATITKIGVNTVRFDNQGSMADTPNNQAVCRRAGIYELKGAVQYDNLGSSINTQVRLHVNSAVVSTMSVNNGAGTYNALFTCIDYQLSVGDIIDIRAYHASGATGNLYVADPSNYMTVTEVVGW